MTQVCTAFFKSYKSSRCTRFACSRTRFTSPDQRWRAHDNYVLRTALSHSVPTRTKRWTRSINPTQTTFASSCTLWTIFDRGPNFIGSYQGSKFGSMITTKKTPSVNHPKRDRLSKTFIPQWLDHHVCLRVYFAPLFARQHHILLLLLRSTRGPTKQFIRTRLLSKNNANRALVKSKRGTHPHKPTLRNVR